MVSRVGAIKEYFGAVKPVTFKELKALIQSSKEDFEWVARECARELGEELDTAA